MRASAVVRATHPNGRYAEGDGRCSIAVGGLAAFFLHRLLRFFDGHVADMRADGPVMPKRIDELAVAITPEHVCHRHRDLRPGLDCAFDRGVDIVDIEVDGDR